MNIFRQLLDLCKLLLIQRFLCFINHNNETRMKKANVKKKLVNRRLTQ